ncbi:4612_t:CDS:2 [Funneliformis geosporum]|nr:4612_t:CDS:2 [Funneliformis geosporum]
MEPSIKNKELAVIYNVTQGKRQIKVNFPEIEEALTLWVLKALENNYENENTGIPLSEEQIVVILKENIIISDDEDNKNIILVASSEALD